MDKKSKAWLKRMRRWKKSGILVEGKRFYFVEEKKEREK